MKEKYTLEFKWTVSRGRDTYGYNICTLRVDGTKVAQCNGGGYDMEGTCLGTWIASEFAEELLTITKEHYDLKFFAPKWKPSEAAQKVAEAGLGLQAYQEFHEQATKLPDSIHTKPHIDGACGKSTVERILNSIGYTMSTIHSSSNLTINIVSKEETQL